MEGRLTFSGIISGTLEVFTGNMRVFAIYIGAMSVLGFGLEFGLSGLLTGQIAGMPMGDFSLVQEWLGFGAGLGGLVIFFVTILAHYVLWEALLGDLVPAANLGKHRYLAFIGLSLLSAIGFVVGFLFFIIPGLLCMGRWLMAPAIMIGEDMPIIEAMRESWHSTSGNTTPIILVIIVGAVALTVLGGLVGVGAVTAGANTFALGLSSLFSQLVANLSSALQVAMGLYVFARLRDQSAKISEVFA